MSHQSPPIVLCLSGHDPTGGAGLQADIETIGSLGSHACGTITALTVQDTRNVHRIIPQTGDNFLEQCEVLLADMPVAAIKIGLLGSAAIARMVAHLLTRHATVPVVLDPILAAGGGSDLASHALLDVIRHELLPQTTVLTPNSLEARRLTGCNKLDDCAKRLLVQGVQNVLITGTHEDSMDVVNTWHDSSGLRHVWRFPRLPHSYHGSGCTLASAIAALLGQKIPLIDALAQAQQYTWQSLQHGFLPGHGQHLPDRFNPHGVGS